MTPEKGAPMRSIPLALVAAHAVGAAIAAPTGGGVFPGEACRTGGVAGQAVIAVDLDADGDPDAVVTNEAPPSVSVLLNDGGGRFALHGVFPVGERPRGLDAGDIDGDGRPDIAVACWGADTVCILRGVGDGTLIPTGELPSGNNPEHVRLRDLNGDHAPDLIVSGRWTNGLLVRFNQAGGFPQQFPFFGLPSTSGTMAIGDFDADGDPDILMPNETIFENPGTGLLTPIAPPFLDNAIATMDGVDLDGDGRDEVVLQAGRGRVVFSNDGAGYTSEIIRDDQLRGERLVRGDLDADGDPDLVFVARGDRLGVSINDGAGAFAHRFQEYDETHADQTLADVDGDGDADLLTLYAGNGIIQSRLIVHKSRGDGSFDLPDPIPTMRAARAIAAADFDGDGLTDLAAAGARSQAGVTLHLRIGPIAFRPAIETLLGAVADDLLAADLNGDGAPDLVAIVQGGNALITMLNDGSGTLTPSPPLSVCVAPAIARAADLDADGDTDLLLGCDLRDEFHVYLNDGAGGLTQGCVITGLVATADAALGDVNGDGAPDLVSSGNRFRVFLNDGQGCFTGPITGTPERGYGGLGLADLDQDGDLDAIATALLGAAPVPGDRWVVAVLHNDGEGNFAEVSLTPAGEVIQRIGMLDINADGLTDAVARWGSGFFFVALGDGEGGFAPLRRFWTGLQGPAFALADLDDDGHPDIASASGSRMSIARNGGRRTPACAPADLASPWRVLDLADIVAFVGAFLDGAPAADFAPPFGVLALEDVAAYMNEFAAGCTRPE
jgi:hypothetical protein